MLNGKCGTFSFSASKFKMATSKDAPQAPQSTNNQLITQTQKHRYIIYRNFRNCIFEDGRFKLLQLHLKNSSD